MTHLEKALEVLFEKGIDAKIENDVLYVCINEYDLELSDFEVDFQASEYEKYRD